MKPSFLELALLPEVRNRALKVALVVGTLLALINHADAVINQTFGLTNALKVLLTYCVPYAVATYSAVGALRDSRATKTP